MGFPPRVGSVGVAGLRLVLVVVLLRLVLALADLDAHEAALDRPALRRRTRGLALRAGRGDLGADADGEAGVLELAGRLTHAQALHVGDRALLGLRRVARGLLELVLR